MESSFFFNAPAAAESFPHQSPPPPNQSADEAQLPGRPESECRLRAGFETTFQTLIALLRLCPGQLEQAMSGHALPVVHVESQPMALLDHPVPVDIRRERHRCRDWPRGLLRPKLPTPH